MSPMGHSRRFWLVRGMSAYPLIATAEQTSREVRFVPNGAVSQCINQAQADSPGH
jgi:hypothetical protein